MFGKRCPAMPEKLSQILRGYEGFAYNGTTGHCGRIARLELLTWLRLSEELCSIWVKCLLAAEKKWTTSSLF